MFFFSLNLIGGSVFLLLVFGGLCVSGRSEYVYVLRVSCTFGRRRVFVVS